MKGKLTTLAAWLFGCALILGAFMTLHSVEAHAQVTPPPYPVTDTLVTQDVSFVTRDAEDVFWQVADNAPVILVIPVYPSMTRVDGQGFISVKTDHAPVFWRQTTCYEANELPFDINASNLVCSAYPGLDTGDFPDLAITTVDLQTLFDNRGYAIGAIK